MLRRVRALCTVLLFLPFLSGAQPWTFSVSNPDNSDWRLSMSFTYQLDYCNCGPQSTQITIHEDFDLYGFLGPVIATYNNLFFDGANFVVGPGFNETIGANFVFSGERTWLGTSGGVFCVHTICGFNQCPCGDYFESDAHAVSTAPLKNPVNLTATTGLYEDRVILNWGKGTNFPNGDHVYYIYRDNVYIGQVSGHGPYTYTDLGLMPGSAHTYKVTTKIFSFGAQESSGISTEGSTFSIEATDGEFFNRTRINWSNVPANTEDIRIERTKPAGGIEELAILNAAAKTYNDLGAIPGHVYTYYVRPLDENGNIILTYQDNGYSRPNGTISGYVVSTLGAGVMGADIHVQLQTVVPPGGQVLPPDCPLTYCATTDASGYYEIKDVFYFTGAQFRIHPEYPGIFTHIFTPDTLFRSLDENVRVASGVNFTDETVLTVEGRVTFPPNPDNGFVCGVKDAVMLVDGKDLGVRTDANGDWQIAITDVGAYTFGVSYHGHTFETPLGDTSYTVFVDQDISALDFENVTQRSITIIAQGGCQAPLGDYVTISVTAPGNCFYQEYQTNAQGVLHLTNLPPRDYTIEVTDIETMSSNLNNMLMQIGDKPVEVDLTNLDTMTMITEQDTVIITPPDTTVLPNGDTLLTVADTSIVHVTDTTQSTTPLVRFIYRSPVELITDFDAAGADVTDCARPAEWGGGNTIVMEQGGVYVMQFLVRETLGFECYIDSGTLVIYDEISDREGTGIEVPIRNGVATYVIEAGEPDISSSALYNHEKFLYVVPKIDFLAIEPVTYWVVVTGIRSNAPTFFTRTPELPQLVIHDPPGDNSYAFVEKGTSFTTFTSTAIQNNGAGGLFFNLKGGPQANIFGFKIKAGGTLEFEFKAGRNNNDEEGYLVTTTFLENFSTSTDELFVGHEGDVYVGAAFNQTFALSDELTYDPSTCQAELDTILEMDYADFATTFIYTEYHIKNILMPTIGTLKSLQDTTNEEGKMEYNRLLSDSLLWQQILTQNSVNRDSLAVFDENISISAGASKSKTVESVHGVQTSYTYESFIETSLKVGVELEIDAPVFYLNTALGAMGTYRWSQTEVQSSSSDTTRTVGYVIGDDDIGDFLSIDVLQDTVYDVPAFRVVSGTTSCPHEPGTQTRVKSDIGVYPPALNNVPPDEAANFIIDLKNIADSRETWEYFVRVVSSTNPDGAIIRLAGAVINSSPVGFFLDHDQTQSMILSVERGPLASNYENIGIMMYPACEYEAWQNGGVMPNSDTAYIDVQFQSSCSNVSLYNPSQNWLINQNSNDILHVTFTGYDINNPLLESLTIQIKREGAGYVNFLTVPKMALIGPYYDLFMDVSGFEDGDYTLRARANCGVTGGTTYSTEVSGIIDRMSLAPFGTPSPGDGFLQPGQDISVTYDKPIDCLLNYPVEAYLIREDNGDTIQVTLQCSGNKIIFQTTPSLFDIPDLQGVSVTAHAHMLQDLSGNIQKYPVEWSFLVNVRPVFWDPEVVIHSAIEGQLTDFSGILKNNALISKAYSLEESDAPAIIEVPEWIIPQQTRGTVLANNDYTVHFSVQPDLVPGIYTGTVIAEVDGRPISLEVIYEVLAKPVNWTFDPGPYENSMVVVAQFSVNAGNAPLSADTRDRVAAFVNGEIRGIANIEYIPENDSYAAYLTVHSNSTGGGGGEVIQFRFWQALTGVEYQAVETIPFVLNGRQGTPAAPFILHPDGTFQVIPLQKGWNWISFHVGHADMSRERLFQSLIGASRTNVLTIKSQSKSCQYSPGSSWNGNLQDLALGNGYMIHLSEHPDTLRVVGIDPADPVSINLSNTWNWIGFPEPTPRPVNQVLEDLSPVDGNELKSQEAFALWDNSTGHWLGSLKMFAPGESYKLKLSANAVLEYRDPSEYLPEPGNFEYNMNVMLMLDPATMPLDQSTLRVGAFLDGKCHGVTDLEFVSSLQAYRGFLLVLGNAQHHGREFEFRVLDTQSGDEYLPVNYQMTFAIDAITGTLSAPHVLYFDHVQSAPVIDGYHLWQSSPNPTDGLTTFRYQILRDEQVRISLHDIHGMVISVLTDEFTRAGQYKKTIDLSFLPGGVYTYTLESDSFSATRKLVRR